MLPATSRRSERPTAEQVSAILRPFLRVSANSGSHPANHPPHRIGRGKSRSLRYPRDSRAIASASVLPVSPVLGGQVEDTERVGDRQVVERETDGCQRGLCVRSAPWRCSLACGASVAPLPAIEQNVIARGVVVGA